VFKYVRPVWYSSVQQVKPASCFWYVIKQLLHYVILLLLFRMDMVVNAGKSRKNVNAFVLLPPDSKRGIDLLIDTRSQVGVPPTNLYVFGRLNADTPMTGHSELAELAHMCPELQYPERITSRRLRTYTATVSQV